jgi:hypothetical protein
MWTKSLISELVNFHLVALVPDGVEGELDFLGGERAAEVGDR